MNNISTAKPTSSDPLSYFKELCSIPHGSRNTAAISDWLASFAKEHGLSYVREECGNIIINAPASPGYENAPLVCLQGHMDMVAVKEPGCDLDMEICGLRLSEEDGWLYAKGTSLGGDDGAAIAIALAILSDDTLPHPGLEAVFTVDEEIGMLGAKALDYSQIKSRILLNLDTEDEGIFIIGCAGGATAKCALPINRCTLGGSGYVCRTLSVSGLLGGHSGEMIHLGRGNAIIILGRALSALLEKSDIKIISVIGGGKDNAIASAAHARIAVKEKDISLIEDALNTLSLTIKKELAVSDPGFCFDLSSPERCHADMQVYTDKTAENLVKLLTSVPDGVVRRMPENPDFIETSLNQGILSEEGGNVVLTSCVRSSVESEKTDLLDKLHALITHLGGSFDVQGVYPGWAPATDSKIAKTASDAYKYLTCKEAKIEVIHAGLECGFFSSMLPGLDCISYGPDIRDIHTPNEKLSIPSLARCYELTCEILKRIK